MKGELGWALLFVALGTAARLAAAQWLGDIFHFRDEAVYVDAARRVLSGEGFGAAYANVPAYPLVLAALAAPWPGSVVMLRSAQAVITAAGVVLVLLLGRRTVGAGPARVGAALYALDPLLVVAGGLLYAEAIAAVVLLAVLLAAWSAARQDRAVCSVAAGLLLGLLAQLRPVSLVLIPVVTCWTALGAPRRRAGHALLIVAACVLVLVPWTVRNYRLHGALVPISRAGTQGAPMGRDEVAQRGLTASLVLWMWHDPAGAILRTAREFVHFWEPYPTRLATDDAERRARLHGRDPRLAMEPSVPRGLRDGVSAASFGIELVLAVAGLGLAWRRRRAAAVLLATVSVTYGFGYALFIAKLRYRIPVLPCLFLLAGVAMWTLLHREQPSAHPPDSARVHPHGL